jgi:hypothetical protein
LGGFGSLSGLAGGGVGVVGIVGVGITVCPRAGAAAKSTRRSSSRSQGRRDVTMGAIPHL